MKDHVLYKGVYLHRNTQSHALWESKELQRLDQHLKMLDTKNKELQSRYK